ncbi:MAG: FAD binding domain-containing protein [Planctomycetota bacterium]|jgi:xanthine dehydrogenase YagS FAD-binding subunit
MNRFAIAKPASYEQAGTLLRDGSFSLPVLKAGGMDVVDHLKEGLMEPDLLVDVKRVRRAGAAGPVGREGRMLRIEAGATLADIASSSLLAEQAPVVAQAVANGATPQVRNVATAAGNLLQRPRCWYYRNEQFNCLKKGGFRCYAVEGENAFHAVFSDGPCYIVHPSNLAPALYVCNGVAHLTGGERDSIAVDALYHVPERGIRDEHNLEPGEIVTHLTLEPAPRSGFYVVKEKQSFDWPLAMAAVALDLDGSVIRSARICAGAVAPVPHPLPRVEQALRGVAIGDDDGLAAACALASDGAKPLSDNAYKLKLLPVVVRRAVLVAAGRTAEVES